jgi:adenylate cyclase
MDTFSEKWPQMKLDAQRRIFINYQGPPSSAGVEENVLRVLPASAVLTGIVPKEWFQDQIVLIGAGFADNTDAYRTPFYSSRFNDALMPGVEIHANSLATILSGKTITLLNPISSF